MKRIFLALLMCSASQEISSAGIRNVMMHLDWSEQTLLEQFKDQSYQFKHKEAGAESQTLLAALQQKAAPIIVSSRTWYNAIEPGKIFDIVKAQDLSSLKQYPMLSKPQNLKAFKIDMLKDYDPQKDLMRVSGDTTSIQYFMSYQTFFSKDPIFKPNEWMVKKLSDYLYVLIPIAYLEELAQRKDTPAIARQLSTSLTARELMLGMKIDKLADVSSSMLLDLKAHVTIMQNPLEFSNMVLEAMPKLFVTRSDLKFPGGNKEETDINEAYFLHEWLVYLDGHGSQSIPGEEESSMAFTAGLMQDDFRKLLSFFNNRVKTGSFLYISCYSGGQHLLTLFEHSWDYPKTVGKEFKIENIFEAQTAQIVTKEKGEELVVYKRKVPPVSDIFNYLIIATNQFYTKTLAAIFSYNTTGIYYNSIRGESLLDFANYFKSMAQLLHPEAPSVRPIPLKQQLETSIRYVHHFDFTNKYQIPAIRFPHTKYFVSLNDLGSTVIIKYEEAIRAMNKRGIEETQRLIEEVRTKGIPQKVQESIKAYEGQAPVSEATVRKEKESKELSGRIEKLRAEQEERENIAPKPVSVRRPLPPAPKPQQGKSEQEKGLKEKEERIRQEKERKAQEWFEASEKARSRLTPQIEKVEPEEKALEQEERIRQEKERKAQEWFEAREKGRSLLTPQTEQEEPESNQEKGLKAKEERIRQEKERKAQEWFEAMKKGLPGLQPVESSAGQ